MFLELSNNNGKKYIRLVESKLVFDEKKGKKVPRKTTLLNLGFLSKYDNGDSNYFEKLKASFKAGKPIIKALEKYVKKGEVKEEYNFTIYEGSKECVGHPKLIANTLLEKILDELDISQFIRTYKQHYGITYDIYGFFKLLVFGRILNPTSKISTIAQNEDYYTPILKEGYYKYNIYDALSFINDHKDGIFNRIDNSMRKKFGRTTNYLFYDVTNFFFEIDENDEDEEDEKGLRKVGVSKENSDNPIVQMSLVMDEQGIPVSIEQFSGNTLDHLTVSKTLSCDIKELQNSRYVFVGDKGFNKGPSLGSIVSRNNGYIVSKSIRGCKNEERKWIQEQSQYIHLNSDFKYKSRIIKVDHTLPNGTKISIAQKQIVYWSKKFFDRDVSQKKSFYETLKEILENPNSFRITKVQKQSLSKYIKKKFVNKNSGEILNSNDLIAILDMDALKMEYDLFGYYMITTSETNLDDLDTIDKYHELTKIEDQFRIMKSTLDSRPIFVRTKEHILAHLSICAIALIIIRLIQRQIKLKFPKIDSNLFYDGLSADRIQKALNKFSVEQLNEFFYRFNDIDYPDLKLILDSFDVNLPLKLFKLGELKQLKSSFNLSL